MPVRTDIEMPSSIARLPMDRGFPVPWFVKWEDGKPDFRIMDHDKLKKAVKRRLCWVCGGMILERTYAYTAGPMCAINRTSAEPPSHVRCAVYSARACPFLSRPHMVRREAGLPEEAKVAAGVGIMRNPGVGMVWVVEGPVHLKEDGMGNHLFHLQDPVRVEWYAEGREATREEIQASIDSGVPLLLEAAGLSEDDPDWPSAQLELTERRADVDRLLPA
jgi:hypothetical protein